MNSLIARARHRSFRSALLAGALLLSGCGGGSDDPLADARKAYAVGDLATARVHIENALQDKPQDGAARLLQGSIMLDMGDAESAEVSLRQAMNDAAIAGQVQEKLAEALIMRRKGKELLALLDGKNALTDDINAYLRVAALQTMDQWDEADAALASGLAAHPNGLKLLATAADRALSKGEFAQAEALGKRALAAAPEAYESQLLAGRLASLRGDLKTAQTHFERARAARPTSMRKSSSQPLRPFVRRIPSPTTFWRRWPLTKAIQKVRARS
jgi:cellulose synthase operon protein C